MQRLNSLMENDFFAYLGRLKYIKRWSLMHSTVEENVMEHSWMVVTIAHLLAIIENKIYGGNVDECLVICLAQYHETSEVITGDLPTPIKYFNSQINSAYKDLEVMSSEKLLGMMPEELKESYKQYVLPDHDSQEYKLMKYADRICAYIKCKEEIRSGNREFIKAEEGIWKEIKKIKERSVGYFIKHILPSFDKSLDELK